MLQPLTGAVRHLVIINVLMFFGTSLPMFAPGPDGEGGVSLGRLWLASFYPSSEFFRPYQIATHMFMHGNFQHLLFNMLSLYIFGSMVEAVWGARRFLTYYLLCGLGAWSLHMGVMWWEISTGRQFGPVYENIPMLGASGAIWGLYVAYALNFPNNTINLLFPPISLRAPVFVALFGGIELFSGLTGQQPGIAHWAHLGGGLLGAILILIWHPNLFRRRR